MRVREGERERGRGRKREGERKTDWREKEREEGTENVQFLYVLHVAIQMWLLQT